VSVAAHLTAPQAAPSATTTVPVHVRDIVDGHRERILALL
jgi:hypothetical protein